MIFRVMFTHYSPKDNKTGIACVVNAPDEEALIAYIDRIYRYGCWADADADDEEGSWCSAEPLTDEEIARAEELGLTIDRENDSVEGRHAAILRFCRGESFEKPTDLYYGHTCYFWEPVEGGIVAGLSTALGDRFVDLCADEPTP